MSWDFVCENIYFSGLLLFQSWYLVRPDLFRVLLPIELVLVFLPYHTIRPFFPKSSFRHSTKEGNKYAQVVKVFYVTAKHFSGYYVNYLIFLGKMGDDPMSGEHATLARQLMLLGGWGTTIAMFLQTLKFKHYIGYITAMLLYTGSFPLFWSCYMALFFVARDYTWVTTIAGIGLAVNFQSRKSQ